MVKPRLADLRIEPWNRRASNAETLPSTDVRRTAPLATGDDDPGSDGDPPDDDRPADPGDERRSLGFIMV
jgi:hypothetical protein